jgi:hypothetical protein
MFPDLVPHEEVVPEEVVPMNQALHDEIVEKFYGNGTPEEIWLDKLPSDHESYRMEALFDLAREFYGDVQNYALEWCWWEAYGRLPKDTHLDVLQHYASYYESDLGVLFTQEQREMAEREKEVPNTQFAFSTPELFVRYYERAMLQNQVPGYEWPDHAKTLLAVLEGKGPEAHHYSGMTVAHDGVRLEITPVDPLFTEDDIISTYSAAQAAEDGVLIDVSDLAQTGFINFKYTVPVYITLDLHHILQDIPPQSGEDYTGRLADVLYMGYNAIKTDKDNSQYLVFTVIVNRIVDGHKEAEMRVSLTHGFDPPDGQHIITFGV